MNHQDHGQRPAARTAAVDERSATGAATVEPKPDAESAGPDRAARRLHACVGGISAAGVIAWLTALAVALGTRRPSAAAVLVVLVACGLAESRFSEVRFGHNHHTLTWSEVALVGSLAFVPPAWFAIVAPLGVLGAHLAARDENTLKVAFNTGAYAVGATLAGWTALNVAEWLGAPLGNGNPAVGSFVALIAASFVFMVWNALSVSGVVALSQNERFGAVFWPTLPIGTIVWAGNTAFGCLLVYLGTDAPALLILAPVLVVLIAVAYRSRQHSAEERSTLAVLEAASADLTRLDRDALVPVVLERVIALVDAEYAEVVLADSVSASTATVWRRWDRPADVSHAIVDPARDAAGFWHRAFAERDVFDVAGADAGPDGVTVSYVSPLATAGGTFGTLRIGFRGEVELDERELRLFRTFANQIATAVHTAAPFDALRAEHRRLHDVVDGSSDGILALDADGTITLWNAAMSRICGTDEADALGRPFAAVLGATTQDGEVCTPEQLAASDVVVASRPGPAGTTRWLQLAAGVAAGTAATTVVVRDVTRERELTVALEQARERAETASRLKSEFLANMSHEIRTPMNGVLGMTELLMGTPLTAEQADFCSTIRSSGESLLTIINDILDFSKIEAGKLDIETVDVALRSTLEDAVALFAERAQTKGVELVLGVDADVPDLVRSDPTRLRQIVSNLVSNAVKFTSNGEVVVQVSRIEMDDLPARCVGVRFAVRDSGIGIPEAARLRLFNAFEQAEGSTTRRFGGTGLGLAISRQLCGLMGGSIRVESTVGVGSTFIVELPLAVVPVAVPATPTGLHGRRVLVLDANRTARVVLAARLHEWGLNVVAAHAAAAPTSAGDVLARAVADAGAEPDWQPELVFADSTETAVAWRGAGRADVPVVVVAPITGATDRVADAAVGIAGRVAKPLRGRQLLQMCNQHLCGASPGASPTVAADVAEEAGAPGADAVLTGRRILLVEDNPVNLRIAVKFLERFGCKVTTAGNGAEALHELAEPGARFDVVLLDCQMPIMDGYECAARIRRNEAERDGRRRQPVVALTANAMPDEIAKCLDAGMDDHLAKPFTADGLAATLRTWIRAGDAAEGPAAAEAAATHATAAEIDRSSEGASDRPGDSPGDSPGDGTGDRPRTVGSTGGSAE